MKKKVKIFNVFNEVYGKNLLVIVGMEAKKLQPYLEKKFKVNWEYEDGCTFKGGAQLDFDSWPYKVVWLSDKITKEEIVPKLSHEVFHLVLRICKDVGVPTYPNIDNLVMDEAASYLMEFYMRQILKKL
jgi:hypothetical protein